MAQTKNKTNTIISVILVLFGLMTLLSGGKALFTEAGIASRGDIVPVVLWFNFISGFFFILAGITSYRLKACVKRLSLVLALASTGVLFYLFFHIYQGGAYETRTLVAMSIRTMLWIILALYFSKSQNFKQAKCNC